MNDQSAKRFEKMWTGFLNVGWQWKKVSARPYYEHPKSDLKAFLRSEQIAAYEKGKADQREEIFVWLASQPHTGLLVTEFSIKFPLINYGK